MEEPIQTPQSAKFLLGTLMRLQGV